MTISGPGTRRYPIRVDPIFKALFTVLGAPQSWDYVDVSADAVHVRLGWLFRARFDRTGVKEVKHHADMYGGWGAHGFAGRWLVNGSSKGIVEIDLEPAQRGWLLGFFPLRLRVLDLSLSDPDTFLADLAP